MPKSVIMIKEEGVERQTVDSAAEEEADEEEFEIERILAYEPNRFISEQTKKKIGGFYVKWKGYTSDDNSWVSVEDCHAEDLISDFWEQHPEQRPKPKGSKQAITPKGGKGKPPSKEVASSKSKSRSHHEDTMEIDSDGPPRKKLRLTKASKPASSSSVSARTNGKSFSKLGRESGDEHRRQISSDDRPKKVQRLDLMNIPDFKAKVRSVETVEMHHGKLFYFLTLKDGTGGAVPAPYARRKIPEMAIDFFEKNLRWREETDRE